MSMWMRRCGMALGCVLATSSVVAVELDLLPIGDPERAYTVAGAAAGELYDTRAGEVVDLEAAVERMARADVVLLGEEHTSMAQHQRQAEIVRALGERVDEMVVGMEFFRRADTPVLEQWTEGALEDRQLLEATGWYERGSFRFAYYRPILAAAREHGARVVGMNVDRSIPRAVSRGGLEALSDEQRAEVGEVTVEGAPEHRYLVTRYFGETAVSLPPAWLESMYAAQCIWDVAMARSALSERPENGPMVVIVGSGHVAYGLGIARRLHEATPDRELDVVTYCPVEAPARDPDDDPMGHPMGHGMTAAAPQAMFVGSLADLVAVFEASGVPAYPTFGLKLATGDDGEIVVERVWPDSLAETAGLVAGDRLLDLNGVQITDLSSLRFDLANLGWGDRLDCRVARDEGIERVAVLIQPDLVEAEAELAPGWEMELAEPFEPAGPTPPTVAELAETTTHLVRMNGTPVRVEVRDADGLAAFHEVGEDGLASRSVYRDPRPDGAVEVRYERDSDGRVLSAERFARSGRRLGG
jgi:uncharacterized iron-regulated protein